LIGNYVFARDHGCVHPGMPLCLTHFRRSRDAPSGTLETSLSLSATDEKSNLLDVDASVVLEDSGKQTAETRRRGANANHQGHEGVWKALIRAIIILLFSASLRLRGSILAKAANLELTAVNC
jgi:hypothetical protein